MANPRTIARLEARIHERAAHAVEFELSDPRATFITVTRVELSSDITSGKIFYSVLGSEGDRTKTGRMLEQASGYLQRQIGRVLRVRRIPHLRWVYDDSIAYTAEMDDMIDQALHKDHEINPDLELPTDLPPTEAQQMARQIEVSSAKPANADPETELENPAPADDDDNRPD